MPSMIGSVFRWRQRGNFVVWISPIFRVFTVLLLHLAEPTLHPLHIIIQLRRAIHIMIVGDNTVPVYQALVVLTTMVLVLIPLKSQ